MKYRNKIIALGVATFLLSSCASVERIIDRGKSIFSRTETVMPVFSQTLSLDENLGNPIGGKTGEGLRQKVAADVRMMQKIKGIYVTAVRDGEAVKVTLPASMLFEPNDSVLWSRAASTLRPLLRYVNLSLYNRIIVAGYMDDTGSERYTMHLSEIRADAVAGWFRKEVGSGVETVTYAFGSQFGLYPNVSEVNRSRNRRIVLYLIPGKEMLDKARRGKLD